MLPRPPAPYRINVNLPWRRLDELGPIWWDSGWLGAELGLDQAAWTDGLDLALESWNSKLTSRPLTVHAPFMDLSPGGIDPEVVEVTRRRLTWAARKAVELGAEALICHAGYDHNRFPHDIDRWLAVSAETWRRVLAAGRDGGLVVVLENVYETGPEVLARLMTELDHPRLGICFDTGHANTWGRADHRTWLTELSVWIRRLHLHDNDGSFDHHLPVGRGTYPFADLFAHLADRVERPGITLEPHRVEHVEPTLSAAVDLIDRYWV